jgi:hypothetical protein
MTFVNQVYQRADAFLFGRRTYDLFAGYWGVQSGNPIADALNSRPKYVASNTLTDPRAASPTTPTCHWSRVRKGELPAAGPRACLDAATRRDEHARRLEHTVLLNAGDDVTFQALIGDEFRAARRSHTSETTGRCIVRRRVRDERVASAI